MTTTRKTATITVKAYVYALDGGRVIVPAEAAKNEPAARAIAARELNRLLGRRIKPGELAPSDLVEAEVHGGP